MSILRFLSVALLIAGIGFTANEREATGFTMAVVGAAGLTASFMYEVDVEVYPKCGTWLKTYDELLPDFSYVLAFQMPDWCPRHEDFHPRAPR